MKYKQRLVLAGVVIFVSFSLITIKLSLPSHQEITNHMPKVAHVDYVTGGANHVRGGSDHVTLSRPPVSVSKPPLFWKRANVSEPWDIWKGWVKPHVLYPEGSFFSLQMDLILESLEMYPITSFDVGYRGTQLKAGLYLEGNQRAVFKPMRYLREDIIDGPLDPYRGYDRHNGEIASFHLDGLLGFKLAPPVVGRRLNLTYLLPVTTKELKDTYTTENGNMCFYGKCMYCKPSESACGNGDIMEGSVTLWLPDWYQLRTWRHPYQRTYIPNMKARWETDDHYCTHLMKSEYYHLLPDIFDTAVFDFLIGNADRHHFETYTADGERGRLMHIDNGKSFGNPDHDELSILTPLRQCCKLRNSTFVKLQMLKEKGLSVILDESLKRDQLYPILSQDHLKALDRRLDIILTLLHQCITQFTIDNVLFNTWRL